MVFEVVQVARFWVEDMDHSRGFDIESQRLEDHVVAIELRQADQAVRPAIVSKGVRQLGFTELTLKLAPIYAREVGGDLAVLLCLQPVLQAFIVDELYATSTLADLK